MGAKFAMQHGIVRIPVSNLTPRLMIGILAPRVVASMLQILVVNTCSLTTRHAISLP